VSKSRRALAPGYQIPKFEIDASDLSWTSKAACKDLDVNLFFPEDGYNISPEAKAVCNGCPVQTHCYLYAEKNYLDYGMFGGLSPKQRDEKRRLTGRNSRKFKELIS
jgi:WhiB family redox-sensing transcriptional regulator